MLTQQDTERWEEREAEVLPENILCRLLQAVAATLKAIPAYGWADRRMDMDRVVWGSYQEEQELELGTEIRTG